ncbi:ABC transporter permease [Polyangium aurulentum]|uniref:ABC transporter permease n=1 Tax=Polyangium aurulentum TaxID=2567896 RepID=UPI0010AE9D0A|nr:ABC transporter permease [Polyangium aurulentum]UQA60126.1 ABC transporter permease [Polyangium aurulentum]
MSAQTGEAAPSGPASSRLADRARYRVDRLRKEPNPLWMRELKQAARLVRTPILLCVIAIIVTLFMGSIGGLMSVRESPATTGFVLFQVFFSVAYFVVTLIGPAVAANSIASEREGRTWEAVILTGLRPAVITRGKFLAAYTAIGMYIVMLAPVGALPFLFGGVTATETIVAFAFLFLIAGLAVAFGLAISSKMNSVRAAIVVTLLLAATVSLGVYLALGVGLSYVAHEAWPGVPDGPPIWLPTAYARAPFDLRYFIFLLVLPVAIAALPAWFLYEVSIANLTSITDDRSTGLKRWFVVAAPVFALATAIPIAAVDPSDRIAAFFAGGSLHFVFLHLCAYLFVGDPLGPSRRVRMHWDREGAGRITRLLGPGIVRTSGIELLLGIATFGLLAAVGLLTVPTGATPGVRAMQIVVFTLYAAGFFLFTVGLGAYLRTRSSTPILSRVLLLAVHFLVAVGPWVVAAIMGIMWTGGRQALVVATPSPFGVFVALDALERSGEGILVTGAVVSACVWGLLGLLGLVLARRRVTTVIANHEAALAHTDRILAEEDAAAAAAQAAAAQGERAGANEVPVGEGEPQAVS